MLIDLAKEIVPRLVDLLARGNGWMIERRHCKFGIVTGAGDPKAEGANVPLGHPLHVFNEPRGGPDAHHQYTSCQWVECPGVPHLRRSHEPLHAVHHVARSATSRFVNVEDAKHVEMGWSVVSCGGTWESNRMSDNTTPPEIPEFDCLDEAVRWAGLSIPIAQLAPLDAYRKLLWEWNEKINLTRHTTFAKFAGAICWIRFN